MYNIDMLPSYIDNTNFKYIRVDDKYIASIVISDYPKKIAFNEIFESIPKDIEYDLSLYIQKQDTAKILKDLTYYISVNGSEKKTAKENQIDIDILGKVKDDAKMLRHDIQINNEEVFYINIILTIYTKKKDELLTILKTTQSRLYSKNLISKITNFRHLDEYLLSLPVCDYNNNLLKQNYRNITTSTMSYIFPFFTRNIFDKNGIMFGILLKENTICNIDIFNNKYLNSNMCIFGSSGSGKSYFTKILILRHYFSGKNQIIFDLEGEYITLIKKLKGEYISLGKDDKKYFNILEITKMDIEIYGSNFLDLKVNKINNLILNLIFEDLDLEKKDKYYLEIEKAIIQAYKKFQITNDVESLYIKSENGNIYVNKKLKTSDCFPTLKDVYDNIKLKKLKELFKINIIEKYPSISNITNINYENMLFSFNMNNIDDKKVNFFMEYFLEDINRNLKYKAENNLKNKNILQTIIYIDEIWKYISNNLKNNLSHYIFEMFKSIRKQNASIVAITQDISDFFKLDNGNYGKSILNNCNFKMFFRLNYEDFEILEKLNILNKDNQIIISTLDKGEVYMILKNTQSVLKVKSNTFEKSIIEEDIT